jgi:Ca2+-transporting ATPase
MLVRRLAAVETLGATTVICTDKTGTLTRGEFQVAAHVVLAPGLSEREFLETSVLACEQHPADAMERAIQHYAEGHEMSLSALTAQWRLVRDYDFDAVGKHMSHVWQNTAEPTTFLTAAKGALEGVLAHCAGDPDLRRAANETNRQLAERGMRVLAVASKQVQHLGVDRAEDENDLMLFGLLGFHDPLRAEVRDAVEACQHAGIRVKMITGDHALTAHAVAESAGILHEDALIVTGEELMALPEDHRTHRIDRATIFARISPQQKFAIVDALKRGGAIVAMTGDGVNDAPALRRADIGIAMGQRGTDVARATADLVLLDDNFASIVATVQEGRHIFKNIQRSFLYLIAFHIPIVTLAIVTPLVGLPLFLLPVHLVWLELIVHPVSALVFQADRSTGAVMAQPPRDPSAPLLARPFVIRSALCGAVLAATTFATYWWQFHAVGEFAGRALALIVLLSGYQMLLFVERLSIPESMSRVPRSALFWIVWMASALSLALLIYVPPAARLFHLTAPAGAAMVIAILVGALSVGWRLVTPRRMTAEPQGT